MFFGKKKKPSKLASMFNSNADGGSLRYTRPTQSRPKAEAAEPVPAAAASSSAPVAAAAASATPSAMTMQFAAPVMLVQYDKQRQGRVVGPRGIAILKQSARHFHLLCYHTKTQAAECSLAITNKAMVIPAADRYVFFYDDVANYWGVQLSSDEAVQQLLRHMLVARYKAAAETTRRNLIRQDIQPADAGCTAIGEHDVVKCWYSARAIDIEGNIDTLANPLVVFGSPEKAKSVHMGKNQYTAVGKLLTGMVRGMQRIAIVPAEQTASILPSQYAQQPLLVQVGISRVKFANPAVKDPKVMPTPAPAAVAPAPVQAAPVAPQDDDDDDAQDHVAATPTQTQPLVAEQEEEDQDDEEEEEQTNGAKTQSTDKAAPAMTSLKQRMAQLSGNFRLPFGEGVPAAAPNHAQALSRQTSDADQQPPRKLSRQELEREALASAAAVTHSRPVQPRATPPPSREVRTMSATSSPPPVPPAVYPLPPAPQVQSAPVPARAPAATSMGMADLAQLHVAIATIKQHVDDVSKKMTDVHGLLQGGTSRHANEDDDDVDRLSPARLIETVQGIIRQRDRLRTSLDAKTKRTRELLARIDELQDRYETTVGENAKEMEQRFEAYQKEAKQRSEQLLTLQKENAALQQAVNQKDIDLGAKTQALSSVQQGEEREAALNVRIKELERSLSSQTAELHSARATATASSAAEKSLTIDVTSLKEKLATETATVARLRNNLEQGSDAQGDNERRIIELQACVEGFKSSLQSTRKELSVRTKDAETAVTEQKEATARAAVAEEAQKKAEDKALAADKALEEATAKFAEEKQSIVDRAKAKMADTVEKGRAYVASAKEKMKEKIAQVEQQAEADAVAKAGIELQEARAKVSAAEETRDKAVAAATAAKAALDEAMSDATRAHAEREQALAEAKNAQEQCKAARVAEKTAKTLMEQAHAEVAMAKEEVMAAKGREEVAAATAVASASLTIPPGEVVAPTPQDGEPGNAVRVGESSPAGPVVEASELTTAAPAPEPHADPIAAETAALNPIEAPVADATPEAAPTKSKSKRKKKKKKGKKRGQEKGRQDSATAAVESPVDVVAAVPESEPEPVEANVPESEPEPVEANVPESEPEPVEANVPESEPEQVEAAATEPVQDGDSTLEVPPKEVAIPAGDAPDASVVETVPVVEPVPAPENVKPNTASAKDMPTAVPDVVPTSSSKAKSSLFDTDDDDDDGGLFAAAAKPVSRVVTEPAEPKKDPAEGSSLSMGSSLFDDDDDEDEFFGGI